MFSGFNNNTFYLSLFNLFCLLNPPCFFWIDAPSIIVVIGAIGVDYIHDCVSRGGPIVGQIWVLFIAYKTYTMHDKDTVEAFDNDNNLLNVRTMSCHVWTTDVITHLLLSYVLGRLTMTCWYYYYLSCTGTLPCHWMNALSLEKSYIFAKLAGTIIALG